MVDSTTTVFLEHTSSRFAGKGAACDFARWLQYYAFDVIGDISFSKRMGFIERFEDVDGIIGAIADTLRYSGYVSLYQGERRLKGVIPDSRLDWSAALARSLFLA